MRRITSGLFSPITRLCSFLWPYEEFYRDGIPFKRNKWTGRETELYLGW
jgi:hypothetical protein